jgi:hypothetical protein
VKLGSGTRTPAIRKRKKKKERKKRRREEEEEESVADKKKEPAKHKQAPLSDSEKGGERCVAAISIILFISNILL